MKVAVCFGTGYEEVEALTAVDILRRGQVDVTMVGVDGKAVSGSHGISVNMDQTAEETVFEDFDMIILPGGVPGIHSLAACKSLMDALKTFKEEGKWIAAICAAPSILGEAGLLEGEKVTCYPGFEEKLLGAEHQEEGVVLSNRFVTAKGAGYGFAFALKLLEIIKGRECAQKVRKGMLIQ